MLISAQLVKRPTRQHETMATLPAAREYWLSWSMVLLMLDGRRIDAATPLVLKEFCSFDVAFLQLM